MDRAEATGLGVAAAGHLALLAALSFGFAAGRPPVPKSDPIEVELVDEVGLRSTAPAPSLEAPAPRPAAEAGPPEAAMPAPPAFQPLPAPQVEPRAVRPAAPSPRPALPRAAPAPPRSVPAKPSTGRRDSSPLSNVVDNLRDPAADGRSANPPAAEAGPEVKASLGRLVREQLRPHWKSPSGADAELLRTELSIWLARDGSVTRVEVLGTSGQTPSNRPQVKLHQEQALRAVRLASPFNLPDKFYDAWKYLSPIGFDRKLSR